MSSAQEATTPAREPYGAGPTRRSWWQSTRQSWTTASDWTLTRVTLIVGVALLAAVLAFWLLRPGGPLGGAEPLQAGLAHSSVEDGRFVYRLQEPRPGQGRLQATLQAIYDAHKGAVGDGPMTVVLLRRAADASPYLSGAVTVASAGEDVLAMVVDGPEGRQAVLRPQEGAPLQPVPLAW